MDEFAGKTVVITGSTGFIGSRLLKKVMTSKAKIIVVTRNETKKNDDNIVYINCPLEQISKKTWELYGVKEIDFIFHLAAFTPKNREEANDSEEIIKNIIGTESLLKSLPSSPKKIIFASSIDVYAPLCSNGFITEDFPLGPSGLYGTSKIYCEQLVRIYAEKIGCEYVVLRFGHVYGPGEEKYEKLIPKIIRTILTGSQPVLYGNRTIERDFLYVDDAVEATIRSSICKFEAKVINIVRGLSVSIEEVVYTLINITGNRETVKYIDNGNSSYSLRFDNKSMRGCLGDFSFTPLTEGLKREVDYSRGIYEKK